MTQVEAIVKALKMLGGRAHLQSIYPLAMEIGDFHGCKTPECSIRNYLQTSMKKFRHSPNMPDGWYELISYQEELAERDKKISELNALLKSYEKEIARLKSVPTEEDFVRHFVKATKNLFGVNRKHADYVRQVLLKMGRDNEQEELLAWIERREQKKDNKDSKKIIQNISNSQIFNGNVTKSQFPGGGTNNE